MRSDRDQLNANIRGLFVEMFIKVRIQKRKISEALVIRALEKILEAKDRQTDNIIQGLLASAPEDGKVSSMNAWKNQVRKAWNLKKLDI